MTARILYLRPHPDITDWYGAIAGNVPIKTERVFVAGPARLQLIEAAYVGEVESLRAMGRDALLISDIPPAMYDDERAACQRSADLFAAARMLLLSVAAEGLEIELPTLLIQRAKLIFGHSFLADGVAYYARLEAEAKMLAYVSYEEGWKAASEHATPGASREDIEKREAAFGCRVH